MMVIGLIDMLVTLRGFVVAASLLLAAVLAMSVLAFSGPRMSSE